MYGYTKGAADGTFKHPRKLIKLNKSTKDITIKMTISQVTVTQC